MNTLTSVIPVDTIVFGSFSVLLGIVVWVIRSYFNYLMEWKKEQDKWQKDFTEKLHSLTLQLKEEYASKGSADILFKMAREHGERLVAIETVLEMPREYPEPKILKTTKVKHGSVSLRSNE